MERLRALLTSESWAWPEVTRSKRISTPLHPQRALPWIATPPQQRCRRRLASLSLHRLELGKGRARRRRGGTACMRSTRWVGTLRKGNSSRKSPSKGGRNPVFDHANFQLCCARASLDIFHRLRLLSYPTASTHVAAPCHSVTSLISLLRSLISSCHTLSGGSPSPPSPCSFDFLCSFDTPFPSFWPRRGVFINFTRSLMLLPLSNAHRRYTSHTLCFLSRDSP